jgi:hypothetical protein
MPHDNQTPLDLLVNTGPRDELTLLTEPTSSASAHPVQTQTQTAEPAVNIPLEDVVVQVAEVNQVQAALELQPEVKARVDAILRSPNHQSTNETVQEYNERVKRDFTEQVMEARRQAARPPPAPQPVSPGILDQTRREMAAGAKQSAYWSAQQVSNPRQNPSQKEIAASGANTPIFQPSSYTHEKGVGVAGKEFSVTHTPGR